MFYLLLFTSVVQVDCSKVPSSASTASLSSSSKTDTAAANTVEKAATPPAAAENKKQEKKVKPKSELMLEFVPAAGCSLPVTSYFVLNAFLPSSRSLFIV